MNLQETIEYLERVSVSDLVGKNRNHPQISDLTAKYKSVRRTMLGKETGLASCDYAGFMNSNDIVFVFSTIAQSENAKRVNSKTFELEDNPSGVYNLLLCLIDGVDAIKTIKSNAIQPEEETPAEDEVETDDEYSDLTDDEEEILPDEDQTPPKKSSTNKNIDAQVTDSIEDDDSEDIEDELNESRFIEAITLTPNDIADLIEVCDVKIWSDDPSTTYQGHNYYLTQIDGSLYPNNIKPKKWNKYHKDDNFMGKHIAALLQTLPSFYKQMANRLSKLLTKKSIRL